MSIFVSQTLLLMSSAGAASPQNSVLTPGLAVALAYMNAGAHLLGIVQLLVGLSVARLGRATQVAVLWAWAVGVGIGSWAAFRRFIPHEGDGQKISPAGQGEGALVGCVVVSVSAAISPTFVFWVACFARALAMHAAGA
jgi:hypothetical protein